VSARIRWGVLYVVFCFVGNSDCAKTSKIFCEILYVVEVCFYSAVCGGLSEFR